MKGLSILGCTGSVGTNVLRIVDAFPGRFQVVGLAGGRNVATLAEQVARHRPRVVSVVDPAARDALARLVDLSGLRVGTGPLGMVEVATHEDARTVVASAVGAVGLLPTYRALEAGKDVALANKETLVMAGAPLLAHSKAEGGGVPPLASEDLARPPCPGRGQAEGGRRPAPPPPGGALP